MWSPLSATVVLYKRMKLIHGEGITRVQHDRNSHTVAQHVVRSSKHKRIKYGRGAANNLLNFERRDDAVALANVCQTPAKFTLICQIFSNIADVFSTFRQIS